MWSQLTIGATAEVKGLSLTRSPGQRNAIFVGREASFSTRIYPVGIPQSSGWLCRCPIWIQVILSCFASTEPLQFGLKLVISRPRNKVSNEISVGQTVPRPPGQCGAWAYLLSHGTMRLHSCWRFTSCQQKGRHHKLSLNAGVETYLSLAPQPYL